MFFNLFASTALMKVLILFCGGTLIMKELPDGSLAPPPKEEAIESLKNLDPNVKSIADIDLHYIANIDSSNMNPAIWDKIIEAIQKNYPYYDGFVITHGTDTMAFTSSALSFSLKNLGKPVILTGAQISGNHIESDARRNFVNSLRLATMDLSGVYLVFDESIILGCRASKVSESKLDAFDSINAPLAGEIRADLRLQKKHPKRHRRRLQAKKGFEEDVFIITAFPGMPLDYLEVILEKGCKGMIIRSYGSGNLPDEFFPFFEKCKEKKVPVVIVTQCVDGATQMELYQLGKQALENQVIQGYDMSMESAVTKLMWLLKQGHKYEEIPYLMKKNFSGEINSDNLFPGRISHLESKASLSSFGSS